MRRRRRPAFLLALLAAAALLAGCAAPAARVAPPTTQPGPRSVYVAVGASETVGVGADEPLRDAWTQVLYRTALPRRTVFYNLGVPGATVADALAEQLPEALRLDPTVVTVWLNVNDLVARVPTPTYERQLTDLLSRLRRGGATRVLVANAPPLDRLPVYLACRNGDGAGAICPLGPTFVAPTPEQVQAVVADLNAAIARASAATGAEVVDLEAVTLAARAAGTEATLVSEDGFHPSTAGYAAVARAFAAVLGRG